MNIIHLKCPSCGAALEAEDNLETFYCKYCGEKIILSGQSKSVIGAKMFANLLDHHEHMAAKKAEEERVKRQEALEERKWNDKIIFLGILGFFLLFVFFVILGLIAHQKGI